MFAGKKSAQLREILISESAWEEMTCLFAPSLVFLVIILMLHLKTASLLSECSEYRTKCDNLYHLCQMQEKELEHLRALIDAHNIDY